MAALLSCPTPWLLPASNKIRNGVIKCKLNEGEIGLHLQAAVYHASIRLQETLRPDPLFLDPYIECLVPPHIRLDVNHGLHAHCLATKFIDDKLIDTMHKIDDIRQVVFLTDGMDTRPYRLNWPASTLLFDISPDRIFRRSIQKLEEVGAKIPRMCLLFHIPSETSDIQQALRSKGYNGTKPSLWVFQGIPILTLADFKETLGMVSASAMKGSLIFGELPCRLVETEANMKEFTITEWMDKLFMSHGLKVEIVEHDEAARNLGKESPASDCTNILFAVEQLQLSDDQMESWRRQFQRMEEDGDEEGFEEL